MSRVTPLFAVNQVGYAVGQKDILSGISFDVHRGEYLGIIGSNGGGKTTLLLLLLGLLVPTSGEIVRHVDPARIGYVPQRLPSDLMFPATVEEVVASGVLGRVPRLTRERRVHEAMMKTGVDALHRERVETLSGGERQRVLLARALALSPDVLCLDEPLSAIDPQSQEDFYHLLRDLHHEGLTIIMVTHDLDALEHDVERVLCLNHHLECHGTPSDTLHHMHGKQYV